MKTHRPRSDLDRPMHDRGMLLFALQATAALGTAIAAALGRPLAAHEEREFEDGEHKARPLDTVNGADVYAVHRVRLWVDRDDRPAETCME